MGEKYKIVKDPRSIGVDSYRIKSLRKESFVKKWENIHPSLTFSSLEECLSFLFEIKKELLDSHEFYFSAN